MKKLLLLSLFVASCVVKNDENEFEEHDVCTEVESLEDGVNSWGLFQYPDDEHLNILLASLRTSGKPLVETMEETVARYRLMGMPDVAGAEFCNLPDIGSYGIKGTGVCGNAWKLSEETREDGRRAGLFIVHGGELIRAFWQGDKKVDRWNNPRMEIITDWEKARLKRAVFQTVRGLPLSMPDRFSRYNPGLVFLFALQLHQHGETVAAEIIVRRLAAVYGADALETAARNALSEALYRSAYWKFCENKDWQEFHTGIQKTLDVSLEGWWWMPGLREMSAQVEAIAFYGGTPLPEGYAFTPEETAFIRELEAEPEISSTFEVKPYISQELWLILETWENLSLPCSQAEREIRAMGMKALPMLAALAEGFPEARYPMDISYRSSQINLPFPHPVSRSMKARRILIDMLPHSSLILKRYDSLKTPVQNVALAFYETHKESSPEELAFQYLQRLDGNQNEKALNFINAKHNEGNHHEN